MNDVKTNESSFGQRLADKVSAVIRSWTFISLQAIFIVLWMSINHWYPSIAWDDSAYNILRLVIAIESSFIVSILLMAQHRQSQKDRQVVYNNFILNSEIKEEIQHIHNDIHK